MNKLMKYFFVLAIILLFLNGCTVNNFKLSLTLEQGIARPNEEVKAFVTIESLSDDPISGYVYLTNKEAHDSIFIGSEDTHFDIAEKHGLERKVFSISSNSTITIEPKFIAGVVFDNGDHHVLTNEKTLRIQTN